MRIDEKTKKLIGEVAQTLTNFRNKPELNAFATAEDIVGKCLGNSPQQSSMLPTAIKEGVKDVFRELDKLRGYKLPKRNAEAQSIQHMLKRNYTAKQIVDVWKRLKDQPFWKDKELFMMTVESQIGAMLKTADPQAKFKNQKYGHLVKR